MVFVALLLIVLCIHNRPFMGLTRLIMRIFGRTYIDLLQLGRDVIILGAIQVPLRIVYS